MLITIDNTSPVPLYQQIVNDIREKILAGELKPGDSLPSIRQLAGDLLISVITTKRAYQDLETLGLIVTRPGKGTFVNDIKPGKLEEMGVKEVENLLKSAASTAFRLGMPRKAIESLFQRVLDSRDLSGVPEADEEKEDYL